ncbi:MAG: metallophosphoesterase [Methanomicrobiales archaeon]|jgi:putative SbcD/Mre11-related phosphoesterase|nr:metallophosphoesterase [Methanomicrobiales archaeon]
MNISFPSASYDDITAPSLLVEDTKRRLIVADLHFGIESELNNKGFYIPSQARERKARLLDLIKKTEPEHLIILGDVKHRIPGTSRQEFSELPFFFEKIRKYVPITVCLGNHDPGLEQFLYPHEIAPKAGIILDEISYMHGHTRPSPDFFGTLIICGHHHPTIGLYDGIGIGFRSPCFVLAKLNDSIWDRSTEDTEKIKRRRLRSEKTTTDQQETKPDLDRESDPDGEKTLFIPKGTQETRVLIMPAFNECVGYDLRQTVLRPFSPISRAIEKETAEVMLLDGTYAGDLESMIRSFRDPSR